MTTKETAALAAMEAAAPRIHNGTYTVSHPDHGHYTLKLWTVQSGAHEGKRMVGLLTGPDNTSDFKPVAFFVGDDEDSSRAFVFRKYRAMLKPGEKPLHPDGLSWRKDWTKIEKKIAVWLSLAIYAPRGYWAREGYELDRSSRCLKCNRELTTPESIRLGIGPVCASKV